MKSYGVRIVFMLLPVVIGLSWFSGGEAAAQEIPADKTRVTQVSEALPTPEEVKIKVDVWRERVRKRLEDIDRLSKTLDMKKVSSQKLAVEELQALLTDLDEEAKLIIEAHTGFEPDFRIYRQALQSAPAVFEQKAVELESRAASKKSSQLQEAYADFASHARKLARSFADQAQGLDGVEVEVAKRIEFVRESREFISDVQGLLAAIPTQGGVETERLVTRINQYTDGLVQAINAMRGIADKIGEPSSKSPPVTPNPNPLDKLQGHRDRLKQLGGT